MIFWNYCLQRSTFRRRLWIDVDGLLVDPEIMWLIWKVSQKDHLSFGYMLSSNFKRTNDAELRCKTHSTLRFWPDKWQNAPLKTRKIGSKESSSPHLEISKALTPILSKKSAAILRISSWIYVRRTLKVKTIVPSWDTNLDCCSALDTIGIPTAHCFSSIASFSSFRHYFSRSGYFESNSPFVELSADKQDIDSSYRDTNI